MMKKFYLLAFGLLGCLCALPSAVCGQNHDRPLPKEKRLTGGQAERMRADFEAEHPILFKTIRPEEGRSPFARTIGRTVSLPRRKATAATVVPFRADAVPGRELWGSVSRDGWTASDNHYGLYTFKAQSPVKLNAMFENPYIISNGGAAIVDGVYHSMELDYSLIGYGLIYIYHTQWNIETGEQIGERKYLNDYSLIALATAQDQTTGTVYGVFSTSDNKGKELGIMDYGNNTRSTIATMSQYYVALGLASDGYLYGVSSDGNLYKIDKASGEETKIGPTGLTIENSEGKVYQQSGEIDQATDIFYWAAVDAQGTSGLYTIDLKTGAATKISSFPANEHIFGMLVPKPKAAEGAPDEPTGLAVSFEGGSTSGTVSFTMPTRTYGGAQLDASQQLSYKVYANDELKAEGTALPGAKVTAKVEGIAEGQAKFTVKASNSVGDGPEVKTEHYIGQDTPVSVENLQFTLDASSGKASLTWQPSRLGIHGGYVGNVTYDVVRYPDSTVVATNLADTTFSETLERGTLKRYSYGVSAANGNLKSKETTTGSYIFGKSINPPYLEQFDTEDALGLFSIVDVNGDKRTWEYNETGKQVRYKYSFDNDGDDWLITPPIHLEKGKIYNVSFKARSAMKYRLERLEVKYGTSADPSTFADSLMQITDVPTDKTTYTREIVAREDMDVYIGFHDVSPKGASYLYLDDIEVYAGRPMVVPAAVTDLKAEAGEQGELTAKITMKAPVNDYAGGQLKELVKVELSRNGKVVKTFNTPAPGEALAYTDVVTTSGMYKYTARAYNSDGAGNESAQVGVYVGIDAPESPKGIVTKDNITSVSLSWNKASAIGSNGGYVDPSTVKYRIYDIVEGNYGAEAQLKGETDATTYQFDMVTDEGPQELAQIGIDAYNSVGESEIAVAQPVIKGKPYSLPFVESFAEADTSDYLWWIDKTGDGSVVAVSSVTADNDGGAAMLSVKNEGDSLFLNSGKIALNGAQKAQLTFSHRSYPGKDASLTVLVCKPDGTADKAAYIDYKNITGDERWTTEKIDLANYKNLPYVVVKFVFSSNVAGIPMYIDAISVRNALDKDIAVSMEAPERLKRGIYGTVKVKVTNEGVQPVSDYTVRLLANGKEIESAKTSEELLPYASKDFTFKYKTSVADKDDVSKLTAEVVYAPDMDPSNNTAEAEIAIEESTLPKPETATATREQNGVRVEWKMPLRPVERVTDDFESYRSFTTGTLGDWTMIDADKAKTGPLAENLPYTGQGQPFAYIVFDPEQWYEYIYEEWPEIKPKSGNKFLASLYGLNDAGTAFADNDDWLVSPELPGTAQTLTFWVSNLSEEGKQNVCKFDVMVSKLGNTQTAFYKLGETYTQQGEEWTEVSVELPEGTKYFAIRNITDKNNALMFMIDDVTYDSKAPAVTGFNIYRDGDKIASVAADAAQYFDTGATSDNHSYAVTALYAEGESTPVSAEIATGIQNVETGAATVFTVYTLDGKLVGRNLRSLDLLHRGVYIVNGKKTTVE